MGAIEPRKNLSRVVRAFSNFIKEQKYCDYHFVVAGRAGWKNEELFAQIEDLDLVETFHFIGYVEDKDLSSIYTGAKALIYISEYEGFGLPPLEAQVCGCPVLASNVSSIPEVLGDSALLIDPKNDSQILEGMKSIINEANKYSKLGLINAKNFSWRKSVNKLMEVYTNGI